MQKCFAFFYLKHPVHYSIEMCYINIYSVTRNYVTLLIKAKGFDYFPLICYEKKAETFFCFNVKRAKIQTMARKHTRSDKVQKAVGLLTNITLLQLPRDDYNV